MKNRFFMKWDSNLKKSTIIYGGAVIVERFISFFTLPVITKNLSLELFGIWTQMVVTMGLLMGVVLLGFHTAIVNFFAGDENNQEKSSIFHAMLGIVLLNIVIIIVITFFYAPSISNLMFGDAKFSHFVPWFGFLLVTEVVFELLTAYLRAGQKIKLLSLYYVIKSAGRVGALAIGIAVFHVGLFEAVAFLVVLQFIFIMFIYVRDIQRKTGIKLIFTAWNERWKEIIHFSLPLVPLGVFLWINNFVDRYLILHILDIGQVGIYSVAYSLAAITAIFYSVLGYTMYPQLAKLWNIGDKAGAAELLRKGVGYYLFLLFPSIALLTILSAPLISMLSTSDYISSWMVVLGICVGIGILGLYQIYFYVTLLAKRTYLNFIIVVVAVLVNLFLNIVLIPRMGILGAAIATALSNSILAFWTMLISNKNLPCLFPWVDVVKIFMATCIMSVFLLAAKYYIVINNLWILMVIVIIAGLTYLAVDLLNKNSFVRQLMGGKI